MSNGNIFVNASGGQGGAGVMYEVDSMGNLVWGPYNADSQKGFRYECDYPGIQAIEQYINSSTSSCFDHTSLHSYDSDYIHIFPNPTSSKVNLSILHPINDIYSVNLIDIFGNILLQENAEDDFFVNEIFEIDLSFFSSGVYFLNITTNSGKVFTEQIYNVK